MKRIVPIILSFLVATTALAQKGESKTITLTDAERTLVELNSDFAFNLFRQTRDTENYVISPLSITYALGMINNGADGITREEICQVLSGGQQTGYADVATMNAFCRKMLTESALLDEDTRVTIANSIFFNGDREGLSLKSAFQDMATTYYDANPTILNFGDETTLGVINQWAEDRTDGMIRELLKPEDLQDPNLVSLLLNAICFKGAWVNPFDESFTQNQNFDGNQRTAMMMWQFNEFLYAENDLYQSVILPYGNGAYQMTLFLPQKGKTLEDVLASMNGKNWNTSGYKVHDVALSMPRIETDTNQELVDIMASVGMKNAFMKYNGHGFLDFCYLGDEENNSDQCWVSMMRQKAHLKLDEKGTEAAAATVIAVVDKAMNKLMEFTADRPFLYIISERSTGTIFFMGQYMGEILKNVRHDISLTDNERLLVESNNDFAFRLFDKARGEKSVIMSPLSITYALGMMNNGADGQTQQEICNVLGFGEAGADAINQFCRKLLSEAPTLDEETTAEIANTIYVNSGKGYELQQDFVDKANEFYDAQPEARNFYDGETWNVINQWSNQHTNGMIPTLFPSKDNFNEDAVSYLLNAIYFKGAWTNKFDKTNTIEEAFNGGDMVPMMRQWAEVEYTQNDLFQAVRLPYGNGAFLMTIFLPCDGKTIPDVLATMDGHNWKFHSHNDYLVDLKMPRFKTQTDLKLVPIMTDLGMPKAFTEAAEFPYFGNRAVFIHNMFQKAAIELDEEGTKAAAVTVIDVTDGMPIAVEFHAIRPFFYIISECSTGSIFFIGQYMGEGTTDFSHIQKTRAAMDSAAIYDLQGRRVAANPSAGLKKGLYIINGKKVVVEQ